MTTTSLPRLAPPVRPRYRGVLFITLLGLLLAGVGHAQGGWMWTEEARLSAPDAAPYDECGAVAVAGDLALLGAPGDDDRGPESGSAHVFARDGAAWLAEAKLTASDGAPGDEFGAYVALHGSTALVAAPGRAGKGAVYVFVRSGTSWTQEAMLTADDGSTGDGFGPVALHGDTALVGAAAAGPTSPPSGAAYVFVRTGTTWSQEARLLAADGAALDVFGHAVDLRGDSALIGAHRDDDDGWQSGAAFVFVRTGTTWAQQAKLRANDAAAYDEFGFSVALGNDRALVGARSNDGATWDTGSAYVFVRHGASWTQEAKLVAADADPGDDMGSSVALGEDRAAVGSLLADTGYAGTGAAYVFARSDTGWDEEAKLTAHDAMPYDYFGADLAMDGDTVLVGAPGRNGVGLDSGSAYSFVHLTATATSRNAGTNPASYSAVTLPVLGGTYTGQVDVGSTTGHDSAWLVGYQTPLTLVLGGGEAVLVNFLDPGGDLVRQPSRSGPVATWSLPIPFDTTLAGFTLSTQALHFGGGPPLALSNAQDLRLGQ